MGRSYEDFQALLGNASTSEERVSVGVQGLVNNMFVRKVEDVDRLELEQIRQSDPDLFAALQPEAVREALVLTGFFRYSLSKGLPTQKEIELEDMPSCSRRDFIIFAGIFKSSEDAEQREEWSSGVDAVKIAFKSMAVLHMQLKDRIEELGEGGEDEISALRLSSRQLRALKNVLRHIESHLMRNRPEISKLLEFQL